MTTKTARAVRPSAAIRDHYRRQLDALIDQMAASVTKELTGLYRNEMGQDASPAVIFREAMRRMTQRWSKKFDRLAERMARGFGERTGAYADRSFASALRDAGFTVRFKATRAMNEALQAVIGENVALIKSIPQEYLTDIEGAVMRAASVGRDLQSLTDAIEHTGAVTRRRAETIARDQNNKATAVFTRVRQKELGITKAKWLHSAGGKTPRKSHVAYSGKTYDVDKGAYIDGELIYPGQKINCRCVSVSIIPGFE